MAGLLKKLQKKRSAKGEAEDLLVKQKEGGVDEPVSSKKQSKNTGLKKRSALLGDGPPEWLLNEKKPHAQVERLLKMAREMVSEHFGGGGEELLSEDDVSHLVESIVKKAGDEIRITGKLRDRVRAELALLFLGKGPLEPLFRDGKVTDIYIDNYETIKVHRNNQSIKTPISFRDEQEYTLFLRHLLKEQWSEFGYDRPVIDRVLDDAWQSRLNIIHPSVSEGPYPKVHIRIPRVTQVTFYDLLQNKVLPPTVAAWLVETVGGGNFNFLVAATSDSSRSFMTSALLRGVSSTERLVIVEEVPQISVAGVSYEKLFSRPGEQRVSSSELLRAAIRRGASRLVVGKLGGEEASIFLNALEGGVAGLTTLYAESALDGLERLSDMVERHDSSGREANVRRISRAFQLVLTMGMHNGRPCLLDLSELLPSNHGNFQLQSIVRFLGEEGESRRRSWGLAGENSPTLEKSNELGNPLQLGPGLKKLEVSEGSVQQLPLSKRGIIN